MGPSAVDFPERPARDGFRTRAISRRPRPFCSRRSTSRNQARHLVPRLPLQSRRPAAARDALVECGPAGGLGPRHWRSRSQEGGELDVVLPSNIARLRERPASAALADHVAGRADVDWSALWSWRNHAPRRARPPPAVQDSCRATDRRRPAPNRERRRIAASPHDAARERP